MKWNAVFSLFLLAGLLAAGCTTASPTPGATATTTVTATPVATGTPSPTGGGMAEVTIQNFAFSPSTVTVKAGQSVRFTNLDGVQHNVALDSGVSTSDLLSLGQRFDLTLNTPGTYAYHCGPHPYMTGTVIVTG